VDSVFAAFDPPGSPGCAVGIFSAGAVDYARGYGLASLEDRSPITSRTVFQIGSVSKMFTAAAVALLARDGMLTLDDDIRRYVPELPAYGRPIRIRHLLNHTSGLREIFILSPLSEDPISTNEQGLRLLARQQELEFDPGERFRYTNSGYLLLAIIVERVSGESLREYLARHFFAPLEMEATHVHDDLTMVMEARATGYGPLPNGEFQVLVDPNSEVITGPGAVNTTIEDLARWDKEFYSGTVGGEALWKEVSRPGRLNDGSTVPYGLGIVLDEYRGLRRMRHGGTWLGWRAQFVRFPDQRRTIAVLCNSGGQTAQTVPLPLAERVADILLDGTFRVPPADSAAVSSLAVTEEALRSKVGVYYDSETGEILRISFRDGKLIGHDFGMESELRPAADNEFEALAGWLRIVFDSLAESGGRRLNRTLGSNPAQTFLSVESTTLGTDELRDFEGEFHSEEVGVSYQLVVVDGQLLLRERNGTEKQLAPAFGDAFTVENMSIRFGRDAEGNVVGFRLSASRLWNLRFDRVVPANENHP
jgi:CubicO group peptidase (beta-lactamase class C family)